MSERSNGDRSDGARNGDGRAALEAMSESRRRAELIGGLRKLSGAGARRAARPAPPPAEHCDLCGVEIPSDHRHMVHLDERRILCACETCWSSRSADPDLRPAGVRTVPLPGLDVPDELWARFEIPIGLAFFMRNGNSGAISAMYPSPVGATESELDLSAWEELRERNPRLEGLEPDSEALIADRTGDEHRYVIAPIDDCYRLVGMIKASWEGLSGGDGPERAIESFFAELDARGAVA